MAHLSETELDDCQLIARNEASIFTAQRVIQYDAVMRCAIKKGLTLEHVPAMVEALTTFGYTVLGSLPEPPTGSSDKQPQSPEDEPRPIDATYMPTTRRMRAAVVNVVKYADSSSRNSEADRSD